MSYRMRLMGAIMRPMVRIVMSHIEDPHVARRQFATAARLFRTPPEAAYAEVQYGTQRALWVTAGKARGARILLYIHGGGYIAGSADTHKKLVARLCRMAGMKAFLPEYRLAPEHPMPAALRDARAAWDHLLEEGYLPENIVLGGDSAGGGIALALLSELCEDGTPPAGAFAWSPFTDVTFSGASVRENEKTDHFFPGHRVQDLADMILGDFPADDPRVSPLFARFPSCPPVLLQASHAEILRDDSLRMAKRLEEQGADVTLQLWEGAPHVWHFFDGWFPEARDAIRATAHWLRSL